MAKTRRRVRRIREVHPIFEAKGPNEIWSVAFKGEFRMGDGRYCCALTVMDACSRYVLAVVGMHQPTDDGAKAVLEALFKKNGLPKQIHSERGAVCEWRLYYRDTLSGEIDERELRIQDQLGRLLRAAPNC